MPHPHKSSRTVSKNVVTQRGKTSIRLEPEMWNGLHLIAKSKRMQPSKLVRLIETEFPNVSRTSAVRTYIFKFFFDKATKGKHAV